MGMVVRTNTMAVNAFRQLGMNNTQVGKSLEKLSSGYRVNRAGDDASGLAISEKMKAQIRGLETASANSQDGISLVQTAEGALTEVHDMLNRMVELAGKAANGTMDNVVDRASLQKEVDALKDEINRIAKGTNFNGTKLLDGSLGAAAQITKTDGADAGTVNATEAVYTVDMGDLTDLTDDDTVVIAGQTYTYNSTAVPGSKFSNKAELIGLINADSANDFVASAGSGDEIIFTAKVAGEIGDSGPSALTITSASTTYTAPTIAAGNLVDGTEAGAGTPTAPKTEVDLSKFTATKDMIGLQVTAGDKKIQLVENAGDTVETGFTAVVIGATVDATGSAIATAVSGASDGTNTFTANYASNKLTLTTTATGAAAKAIDVTIAGGKGLTLQVGDTADDYNKVTVKIGDMSTKGLGIDGLTVSDQDSASAALQMLRDVNTGGGAINIVSSTRADLGALQNRLEHTINNLDVAAENMTAANSRIRDTDMAKQMMEYTKMNVLTQSAQSMLAQANMQPQSILQLLQ